ncbi:hypothetical protein FHX57_006719 [Paraburkholderia tropica]|uniref:hypothetical protein n=1 Tax=Paraburkholderia tropica TaxID=92647 RepID=UPI0016113710|nr:hypothetical protein [Paraburkholderia tropica]MBB3004337.1 hypothetical protein [Paraburkholderia tropica]
MKKLMLLAAGIVALVAFAGCATVTVTPAQIATALCAPTNTAIADYKAFAALYPTLPAVQTGNEILTKYQPVVTAVCAEGATVTATNVQDLISQGIPAVAAIVATVPMPASTQTAIQAGFAAAELVVNLVGTYESALSTAQTEVASGASADAVVAAAKMSVKVQQ